MLQAATHRLSRTSLTQSHQDVASSLSPSPSRSVEQRSPRSTRRLSKISATEFDSVLSAGETVRIKSREPELGDPASEQTAFDATTAPPARQGSSRDLVDANSAPEGNSAIVKQAPQPDLTLSGGGGTGRTGSRSDLFRSTDPAGTSPAFNTAPSSRPSSSATHYDSLVAVGAIDPVPTPSSRRNSTAPPADAAIPVAFPGRSTDARPPPMIHSNASSSTLATAFGLSPRRRRVQSDETVQDRSFAGTMRKTSRFFRKFGSNSDTDQTKAVPTATSTAQKSSANSAQHLAPPVPAAPPPYTETTRQPVPERPVTPPARQPIAARLPRTPPGRSPNRNATASGTTVPLIFPSPEKPGRRRRSVSMSSLERRESRTTSSTSGDSPVSTRSRPGRSEDERLKRELRKWKVAIEGVLDDNLDDNLFASSEAAAGADSGPGDPGVARPVAGILSPAFETELSATAETSRPSGSTAIVSTFRADTPEIRLHSPSANPDPPLNSEILPDPRHTSPVRPAEPGLAIIDTTPIRTERNDSIASDGQESPSDLSLREFLARAERSPPAQVATLAKAPATDDASSTHPDAFIRGEREVLLTSSGRESPVPYTPRPQSRTAKSAAGRHNFDDLDDSAMDAKAQEIAQQIYEGDESFVDSRKAAEWLGSSSRISGATLRHYLQKFDFAGLRLDGAFRRLCNKLYLKAETQQVDRILEQFSLRYFQENPQTPFASPDIVHAVSYSVLLLNTDLHIVDSTTRMTRQQFVRNTLEAIRAQAELDETALPPALLFSSARTEGYPRMLADETASVFGSPQASTSRITVDSVGAPSAPARRQDVDSPSESLAHLPASPAMSRTATTLSARGTDSPVPPPVRSESVMSLNSTFSHRSLEVSLQSVLKDIYAAVKSHPIYQTSTGSASTLGLPEAGRSSISLNPAASPYATWSPHLQRRASHRSTNSTVSGVGARLNSHKRASVRGLGALIGASSLDLVRSTSPTPSTATSLSDEHWGFAQGASMLHQGATNSIGFASNLAHTIIKEQHEDDARSEASLVEITDEELALLGAPWAKEGLLERKHYWETAGKRSKEKSWLKAFVVVSAGELRMFRFGADSGGGGPGSHGALGGGDWSTNASNLGALSLVHALASTVPPPGYNRSRPHCFIFTLPDGGSFFFQAGTPDLVAEWVSTCNYWSARLSREPLAGGVSNMEYGWNRVDASDTSAEIASIRSGHSRRSFASAAFRHGAPLTEGDRLHINDWTPPQTPLAPSQLAEDAQLEALKRHLTVLQKDIRDHEALKSPMTRLYSPRSSNATKALANWTRKAQHLQSERVKYSTYIETLSSAIKLRALHNGKKEVEHMLATADAAGADEDELVSSPRSTGTIDPHATPIAPISFLPSQSASATEEGHVETAATSQPTSGSQQSSTADFFESRADTPSPA